MISFLGVADLAAAGSNAAWLVEGSGETLLAVGVDDDVDAAPETAVDGGTTVDDVAAAGIGGRRAVTSEY